MRHKHADMIIEWAETKRQVQIQVGCISWQEVTEEIENE